MIHWEGSIQHCTVGGTEFWWFFNIDAQWGPNYSKQGYVVSVLKQGVALTLGGGMAPIISARNTAVISMINTSCISMVTEMSAELYTIIFGYVLCGVSECFLIANLRQIRDEVVPTSSYRTI